MSHHFDTKLAKEDPSVNVCDFYLFQGSPDTTVMALTVNPDVGLSASDILHPEGLYAFRFDLNGDGREEVAFKFQFSEPAHADGDEHVHVQKFQVRRSTGAEAVRGAGGKLLMEGETGSTKTQSGISVFVGTVPDMFAGDAVAIYGFLGAFKQQRYDASVFSNRTNYFLNRNITAIVLEVPNSLIGKGKVHSWATASLHGHAPELQVSRWGLPMFTHIFLCADPALQESFNTTVPSEDLKLFAGPVGDFTEKMVTYAGSAVNPSEYRKQVVSRLCPSTLPYEIGTAASFDFAAFNGRALADDTMDVMMTLAANKPLEDGAVPDRTRTRPDFPYFGKPFTKEEQTGVVPVPRPPKA